MKKRMLALLGACLLAVSAVTGCSSGAGTGTAGAAAQSTTEAPEAGQTDLEAKTGTADAAGQSTSEATEAAQAAEGTKLVILHTNDMHGYMQAADVCLGIGAVAQLKKDYEQQGYDVLLMDAGDYLQGSSFANFTQGESVVEVMNAAGYDVAALGNHEFDYGSDVLEKRISEMNFPALAANITVDATGEPFTQQNAVFTLSDGTKVGVFGLDTPSTSTSSAPKNTAGLSFCPGRRSVRCSTGSDRRIEGPGLFHNRMRGPSWRRSFQ